MFGTPPLFTNVHAKQCHRKYKSNDLNYWVAPRLLFWIYWSQIYLLKYNLGHSEKQAIIFALAPNERGGLEAHCGTSLLESYSGFRLMKWDRCLDSIISATDKRRYGFLHLKGTSRAVRPSIWTVSSKASSHFQDISPTASKSWESMQTHKAGRYRCNYGKAPVFNSVLISWCKSL